MISLSFLHHPMRSIGKIFLACLLTFATIPVTFAQQAPDMFSVEVSPSSFDANTPVDVTIKALKANWDIVKDYVWDVYIEVNGLDTANYTVPSEWLYSFVAQDQGVKTFSKGLIIKTTGTYTIKASDVSQESIKGEQSVIVWWWTAHGSESTLKNVSITSPSSGSTVTSDVAEIIGTSDIPNTPFEIFLNGQSVNQWTTDQDWGFIGYVNNLSDGNNAVQVRMTDINNATIGESDEIWLKYASPTDSTFNSIQVIPRNTVNVGDKVTFNIKTSSSVTSATIKLSNWRSAPMDMSTDWVFTKDITVDTTGKLDVSLDITASGKTKTYNKITMLIVNQWTQIGKVRTFSDSVYKDKLTLTWDVVWTEAPKYLVAYWLSWDNLNQSQNVTKKEVILENLTSGNTYYFKITPLDASGKPSWTPSDIISAVVGDSSEMSCTVQGIAVNDVISWSMHLLTRSGVQNVDKYIIYRSDTQTDISNMQNVWETTDTSFQYPFNPNAKTEKYSYYAVQAICKDWKAVVIGDIKKVKTWPMENIFLFIFIWLFFYGSYRLYGYNNQS